MPYWFEVIRKWKEMGKGYYGVTFPFLVGAIAYKDKVSVTKEFITEIFDEIANNPVEGFYCEVRWCGNIEEPVASIKPYSDLEIVAIKGTIRSNNVVSMGFTQDLMSMFNLNCETSEECLDKLIDKTSASALEKKFSKNSGKFTEFNRGDRDFIDSIIELTRT